MLISYMLHYCNTLNICPSGYFSSIPLIMTERGGLFCPKDFPSIVVGSLVCAVEPVADAESINNLY